MRNCVELIPVDGRKSFYGKARVYQYPDGSKILQSYCTDVAKITPEGKFIRLWSGYSQTTMRHINAFLSTYHIPGGGAAWWNSQPVSSY